MDFHEHRALKFTSQKYAAMMKMWIVFTCLSKGWIQTASVPAVTPTPPTPPTPPTEPVTPTEDESAQLVDWLTKYGYLPPPEPSTGQLQAWTAVTNAIRAMQRFAGLRETGVVDEDTLALMKSPRCSLPDKEEPSKLLANQDGKKMRRKKRDLSLWTSRNINWRLNSYPSTSHLSREMIRSLVFYALRVWAEPTPLEFHEVASWEAADLQVDFLRGYHGDEYPFDGAGGAVGHAFFPSDPARAGGVHLDADEEWAFRQPASEGTDLFTVLVHEFGHALGLAHSSSQLSVMRPYYQGPAGDPLHYHLGQQDLQRITQLYGNRNQLLATDAAHLAAEPELPQRDRYHHHHNQRNHHHHRHGSSIDRCNTSFDAVAKIRGETFFFKGQTVWRVNSGGLVSGRGASVRRLWGGLPADLLRIHAVVERHSDHAIIFISGSQFWVFRDLSLQDGYPRPVSALRMGYGSAGIDGDGEEEEASGSDRLGLVWDPEEGPVWGKVKEPGKEWHEDIWTQLLEEGVNGITKDHDGSINLFKGNSYWKFMFPGSSPLEGYPRSSAADWLDCTDPWPAKGNFSLSLTLPAGRQELKERWWADGEDEDTERRKRRGHGHKHREHSGAHSETQCTCRNAALGGSMAAMASPLLLATWTVLAV